MFSTPPHDEQHQLAEGNFRWDAASSDQFAASLVAEPSSLACVEQFLPAAYTSLYALLPCTIPLFIAIVWFLDVSEPLSC
jgi:hypothetical protein